MDDMGKLVADEIVDYFYWRCHYFPVVRYRVVAGADAPAGFEGFDEDFGGTDRCWPG